MRVALPLIAVGLIFTSCIPADNSEPTIDRLKPIDFVPIQIEPEPEPDPVKRGKITAITADWCVPCQQWKVECLDDLRSAGWEVVMIDDGVGPYPTFTAETGGKKKIWFGYSDRSGFIAKLRDLLSQTN
jgi:hypothetical protein